MEVKGEDHDQGFGHGIYKRGVPHINHSTHLAIAVHAIKGDIDKEKANGKQDCPSQVDIGTLPISSGLGLKGTEGDEESSIPCDGRQCQAA